MSQILPLHRNYVSAAKEGGCATWLPAQLIPLRQRIQHSTLGTPPIQVLDLFQSGRLVIKVARRTSVGRNMSYHLIESDRSSIHRVDWENSGDAGSVVQHRLRVIRLDIHQEV